MNVNTILNNYDLDKDKKKNYSSLEKKINNLLELLEYTDNEDEQKNILNKINEIKELLSNTKIDINETYPSYNDKDFIKKLLSKKEFAMNKIQKGDQMNIQNDFFELSNNQKFIKKLISPETPYRSLYLYHSVGVGKTCASIQVTQNFKKYYNKKALILLPLKLKDNYVKGLFDVSKLDLKEDNMEQCLSNYYLHNIVGRDRMDIYDIKAKAKKMINNEYEILSFGEFGNLFKKIEKNSRGDLDFLNKIRTYFDDRVIIVDEVHNMRIVNEDVKGKEVSKSFHRLLEILKNNVLLLLSATPMFDNYNELRFILNTLLIQNGEKKINEKDKIFDENDKLNKNFEIKLKKISNNFISYMRGENPFTFPIRLYPSINDNKNILEKNEFPKLDIKGKKISKNEQIKHLEFIHTTMSDLQQKMYNSIKVDKKDDNDSNDDNNNNDEEDEDDEDKTDIQQRVQISNIIYDEDDDIRATYGNEGLKRIFKIEAKKKGNYKIEYKNRKKQILDNENIEDYSPKIKLLLKNIKKSEGIVLVYSRYLASGVIPIAIALEHNGFNKLNNKNILKGGNKDSKDSKNSKNKGSYVIISGNTYLSPNNTKEITECVSKGNKDGDKVKVILITESGTEGLDLKNVREIHIFDPWYNLNRLEQVVGRGVRNFSHFDLPEVKRNTTIYQYVNLTQDNKRESIDFRTYRIAENKQKQIALLERTIKRNAIDCNLNINGNKYNNLDPIQLLTSRGKLIEKFNRNDKKGSRICDYRDCDLKCDKEIKISAEDIKNLDETTYKREIINYEIKIIRKYLIKYFQKNNVATIEDLMKIKNFDKMNKEIIYFALNNLIKNKKIFKGKNNRRGYIIYKSNTYIFQPEDIKDEKILIEEREKNKIIKRKKIDITKLENNTETKVDNDVNDKKSMNYNEYLDDKIKYITDSVFFDKDDLEKYKEVIYDIIIDGFSKIEFSKLLKNIFKNNINDEHRKNIIASLKRGYYIQKNENVIYNYFIDKFVCFKNNKVEICSPIETTQNKNLQKKSIKSLVDNIDIDRFGYYEIIDDVPDFKLIDLEKLDNNKKVSGTRCRITTTITTKKIEEFIKRFDKNILKSKEEILEIENKRENVNRQTKRKKYVKTGYCLLYQIVLRNKNTDKKLYFVRPILNNYLNKM